MHSKHFLSRRSTILTCNGKWQPVPGQAIEYVVLPHLNFWKATLLLYSICVQPKGCSLPFLPEEKQSSQKPEKYLAHLHPCLWQQAFYNGLLGKLPYRMVQETQDWIKIKRPRHRRDPTTVSLIFCIHCPESGCFQWGTANTMIDSCLQCSEEACKTQHLKAQHRDSLLHLHSRSKGVCNSSEIH